MVRRQAVKGMVAVAGVTYRIVRIQNATYAVVRILDDVQVGTFRTLPVLEVVSEAIEPALMLAIARHAMQLARTSWARQSRPTSSPSRPPTSSPSRPAEHTTERVGRRAASIPPRPARD